MVFLLTVGWQWRDTGNKCFCLEKAATDGTSQGEVGHGTFFPLSFSGQEAGGHLPLRPYPLNNPVWPVLSTVLGTGRVRCPQ